jgi:hypothetical protein
MYTDKIPYEFLKALLFQQSQQNLTGIVLFQIAMTAKCLIMTIFF